MLFLKIEAEIALCGHSAAQFIRSPATLNFGSRKGKLQINGVLKWHVKFFNERKLYYLKV